MTIETEIANLATQATALLGAVNTSKSTLDEKVATATTQAVTATTKASDANASAGQSAGSAAQALQVYATAAAMNAALATAAAQSSAAQTAAASASSILQQDLAAVSAALHRSPNAVTAMCIYDTSKDSEGGSWPERMQHTSWMNEPLCGTWLPGGFANELAARGGDNLLTYPETLDNAAGWLNQAATITKPAGYLIEDANVGAIPGLRQTLSAVNDGAVHTVTAKVRKQVSATAGARFCLGQSNAVNVTFNAQTGSFVHNGVSANVESLDADFWLVTLSAVPSAGVFYLTIQPAATSLTLNTTSAGNANLGSLEVMWVKVNRGSAATGYVPDSIAAGSYYQSSADGKFYKLGATFGALTEVFRGNTAKFPRLAAIVAEAGSVTIYDLTQPGRPMWMRFKGLGGGAIWNDSSAPTCTVMQQGVLLIGSSGGLWEFNFLADTGYRHHSSSTGATGTAQSRIAGRNAATIFDGITKRVLVNGQVNAIAMTVLPDAVFDVATGLQTPTISVFTAGGISVIQDTGTVVNSALTTAFTAGKMDADGLLGVNATGVHVSAKPRALAAGFAMTSYLTTTSPALLGVPTVMAGSKAMKEFGNASGVTVIKENPSTPARGLSARIASTYNTGWMGDIRRAYMCDTEAEAIGPSVELVTNGTFGGGTTGWTASGSATLEIVSGELKLTATPNVAGHAWQAMPTVVGRSYAASATVRSPTNAGITMRIGTTIGGASNGSPSTFSATNVPMNQLFVATATTTYISFINGIVSGGPSIIDNVSLKEVIPDRSYKAASASIYGTLVKSPVSPGSQLVAWSGFSTTNYGQEPYSADMDYGVGEWSVGAWVSTTGYGPHNVVTASESSWVTPAATSIVGFDSSHQIADNASVRTTYKTFAGIVGQIYTTSVFVQMDDNSAPVVTQSASTGDFAVVAHGAIAGVDTGAPPAVVTHIGGNVYRVSVTAAASSTSNTWGVVKYTGSTAKGFRLTGIQVNRGTLQPYYKTVASPFNGVAVVVERSAATGPSLQLGLNGSGQLTATAYDGTTTRTVTTTAAYNTGVFTKARATYLATGKLGITVNGVEVASATGTPLLTMSNANAVLTIGNSRTLDAPFPGSLTLVKLGATVPTPEQSQWMYEQEKQMFRADAQITLPAATPVLDLTYDESQDKWVALQAGYESSFTGLIRTSAAVPSAGSFSKVDAKSGGKLLSRSTTNPGVDVTIPAYGLREELVRRGEAAAKASKTLTVFDFDAVAAQTDFQLPMGWTATEVLSAGASQREGTTKAWTRQFDGFRETVKFAVAPGAAVWVQITARKE